MQDTVIKMLDTKVCDQLNAMCNNSSNGKRRRKQTNKKEKQEKSVCEIKTLNYLYYIQRK